MVLCAWLHSDGNATMGETLTGCCVNKASTTSLSRGHACRRPGHEGARMRVFLKDAVPYSIHRGPFFPRDGNRVNVLRRYG